jgi:ABC-type branched-subunit amino acid transport system substrate-binding protein
VAVIGPGGDEGAEPVYEALSEFGVPLLSPSASAVGQGAGTDALPWFRMAPSTRVLGENLARVVSESGTGRVAAVIADDVYHSEIGAVFSDRYATYGKLEMSRTIDESSIDYESLTQALSEQLDAGVQGVMLAMQPRPAARLATELEARRSGKPPPKWYLTPRLKTELLLQNASPGAFRDAVGVAPEVLDGTRGEFEQFFAEREGDKPFDPTFYVYDATVVALLAIDRALGRGDSLPEGIPQSIQDVTAFGGVLVGWQGFAQARELNANHSKLQFSGLTGPVILQNDGSRRIGTTSLWGVQDEAIIER